MISDAEIEAIWAEAASPDGLGPVSLGRLLAERQLLLAEHYAGGGVVTYVEEWRLARRAVEDFK